jgi:hypothetical protein
MNNKTNVFQPSPGIFNQVVAAMKKLTAENTESAKNEIRAKNSAPAASCEARAGAVSAVKRTLVYGVTCE